MEVSLYARVPHSANAMRNGQNHIFGISEIFGLLRLLLLVAWQLKNETIAKVHCSSLSKFAEKMQLE